MTRSPRDTAASAPSDTDRPTPTATPSTATPVPAGAPRLSEGFHRIPRRLDPDSMLKAQRDSLADGLLTGRSKVAPTQAETDAKAREKAFDAAVARGSGEPVRTLTPIGGGVSVPLPFGGPSRKQRDRERLIGEELAKMRTERQLRIDSIVAARKRRADSLARAADSIRP